MSARYHITGLGIDAAITEFTQSPRALPRNMLVLTDGVSTNPTAAIASTNIAIGMGIQMETRNEFLMQPILTDKLNY